MKIFMIRKAIILLLVFALFNSCGKIDNYDFPDGGIYGTITDLTTDEGIQSEAPNGFNIKMFEKGGMMNTPITFAGKPDGTFENALVFQNEYRILPVEGPFFNITDTAVVQVGSRTEVNFSVIPFLTVTGVTVTPGEGKVTVSYSISRTRVSGKINYRKTFVSKIPTVNNSFNHFVKSTATSSIPDATLLATTFTDVVTGLASGTKYWVRVGALADGNGYNSLKRYNYSKVFEVTIP
jgi:hypothetical protein